MAARATSRRRRTLILAAALSAVALPGCFTGERPTLASGPLTSGDPAVDEVLIRLDTAPRSTFTGTYEAAAREADLLTPATVSQEGTERRSVTIGDVRFLYDGSSMATCDLADETCSDAIESDWVSDTELTPDFYATGAAARLRADAEARTGQTVAAVEDDRRLPGDVRHGPVGERRVLDLLRVGQRGAGTDRRLRPPSRSQRVVGIGRRVRLLPPGLVPSECLTPSECWRSIFSGPDTRMA